MDLLFGLAVSASLLGPSRPVATVDPDSSSAVSRLTAEEALFSSKASTTSRSQYCSSKIRRDRSVEVYRKQKKGPLAIVALLLSARDGDWSDQLP